MKKAQAKQKRHIYSSGAAGMGKSSGNVVDKRNEEKQCPYCDRIFKQLDRFKQHIAKKHANEINGGQEQEKITEQNGSTNNDTANPNSVTVNDKPAETTAALKSSESAQDDKPKYMQKTPKMLLMELCQKLKKYQKPKYYPVSQ